MSMLPMRKRVKKCGDQLTYFHLCMHKIHATNIEQRMYIHKWDIIMPRRLNRILEIASLNHNAQNPTKHKYHIKKASWPVELHEFN